MSRCTPFEDVAQGSPPFLIPLKVLAVRRVKGGGKTRVDAAQHPVHEVLDPICIWTERHEVGVGMALPSPAGTHFQGKNNAGALLVMLPPWPGCREGTDLPG